MALVEKVWKAVGIQSWQVVKFAPSLDGALSPYYAAAFVTSHSRNGASDALVAEGAQELFGDAPNFTNLKPILMIGDVEGSWVRE